MALLLSGSLGAALSGVAQEPPPPGAISPELAECRENLEVAWQEVESLRGQLQAAQKSAGADEGSAAQLRKRDALLVKLRNALVGQRDQMAALKAELVAERKEREALESASPDRKQARALRRLEEDVADLHADLEKARQKEDAATKENRELEKQLKAEVRKSRDLARELERGEADPGAKKLRKQMAALEAELTKADGQAEKFGTANKELTHTLDLSEKALRRAEREVDDLKKQVAKSQKRIDEQDLLLAERYKEIRDLREALSVRQSMEKHAPAKREVTPPPVAAEVPDRLAGEKGVSPYKLIVQGNNLLRDGKTDEAESYFLSALQQDKSLLGARLGLAACYYAKGRVDEAGRLVQDVLKDDPKNAKALGLAGIIYWQKGDLRRARRALEKGLKSDPTDAQLYNYAGIVYNASQRDDDAVRALRRAVELDPEYGEAAFNLAVLLSTRGPGELDEARALYQKALSLGSAPDESLEKILNP